MEMPAATAGTVPGDIMARPSACPLWSIRMRAGEYEREEEAPDTEFSAAADRAAGAAGGSDSSSSASGVSSGAVGAAPMATAEGNEAVSSTSRGGRFCCNSSDATS